jgi:hypothetical protein
MSDVMHEAQQDFWSPPSPAVTEPATPGVASVPEMAEVCPHCGSEFLFGSHFCHSCGATRTALAEQTVQPGELSGIAGFWKNVAADFRWLGSEFAKAVSTIKFPAWLRYLHFHEIKRWVGLPTASLIAFILGIACVAGALLVGFLTAKTFLDWQAIQFYRAEWLLAATAAFVAGILLKKPQA